MMGNKYEPTVYLNGDFLPIQDAKISVMDRGFLFGDGVYEVIPVYYGRFFQLDQHLERLEKSLQGIQLHLSMDRTTWMELLHKLLEKNAELGPHYTLYLQITRGTMTERTHVPSTKIKPTIFARCSKLTPPTITELNQGISAVTADDTRWRQCEIKSISLLANILLAYQAHELNAREVILLRDHQVTEGSSSNIFIVKNNIIYTPPTSVRILAGVTRNIILKLAKQYALPYEEKMISEEELMNADEIWISSSTREIMPVIKLNESLINHGKPGPVWSKMIQIYQNFRNSVSAN